jgi:transcription antitermination factor NusG
MSLTLRLFMPIMIRKKPPVISPPQHSPQPEDEQWYAVVTRAKCEKMVFANLNRKQIAAYLPLVHTIRRYRSKVRKTDKPLIPGYIFVKIKKTEHVSVLQTEHVAYFVRFNKKLVPIPEEEINLIRRLVLDKDIELEAMQGSIAEGDQIIVSAGALMGYQGKVVKVDGKRKLQIELENMGYSLLITIDTQLIQKMGPL